MQQELTQPASRPAKMEMAVQSGMLKTLGINLYTSIGKVLVEFIANAYDSDASEIQISMPYDRIAEERKRLREELKKRLAEAQAENSESGSLDQQMKFDVLMHVLPEDVVIKLGDDGHGMTTGEVQERFLPINRLRRLDAAKRETLLKSESGNRYVMGRKGLGKLAGFGAAQRIEVWTKRKGETHATVITIDDAELHKIDELSKIEVPVRYEDGLAKEVHGTKITLSKLKADALKDTPSTIKAAILRSFNAIKPEDFAIWLDGDLFAPEVPDYEFIYPDSLSLEDIRNGKLADGSAPIEDLGDIEFGYFVGFRKKKEHLAAKERGARIYCNNRLAAGPTLFGLGTGMHSFHSQDYMECIVEADAMDRSQVDLINTSRTQFKEGNEISDGMAESITSIMKVAIARHAKFREKQAKEEIEKDPRAQVLSRIVETLPSRTREPAKKLLTTIAAEFGVGTEQFDLLAPIVVNTVNASEVLIKLIELGSNPETLDRISKELRELAEIEKVDALKLYRGRRSGIQALLTLEQKGKDQWNRKQTEKELHALLKENPWLIKPEFSNYVSSDEDLNKVVTKLAKELTIDQYAPVIDSEGGEDQTRPDLVFLMSDPLPGPFVIYVVELKSVSKALTLQDWDQLDKYMFKVRTWCKGNLTQEPAVHGCLIGAMPKPDTSAIDQQRLLDKFAKSTPQEPIRIVGMTQLIQEAMVVHLEAIKTLEQELGEDLDDQ